MGDQKPRKQNVERDCPDKYDGLVAKYRGLVISTCLREVRDYGLAEDVAQSVFLLLVKKTPTSTRTSLSSWLFHTSRLLAKNAVRKDRRRQELEHLIAVDAEESCDGHG